MPSTTMVQKPDVAAAESDAPPRPLRIYTFGRFSVVKNDLPLRLRGKGHKKPLDLLKALICYGAREVSEKKLAEALWPDADGDAARANLKTVLHRLRGLISHEDIVVAESRVTLDAQRCWVDLWALERQLTRLLELPPAAIAAGEEQPLLSLYHGPFLQDTDLPCAIGTRERLRSRFLRAMEHVGRGLCASRACESALLCYRKGLEVDPLAERLYAGLMQCYVCLERPAEGLAIYEQCRQTLQRELGVAPCAETQALAKALRGR